jgi:serine/threonine-protein kinase RsbW
MEISFDLVLPSDAFTIPATRHIMSSTMAKLGISQTCIDDVEIALTEACTNVLKHSGPQGAEYEVHTIISSSLATIEIRDRGSGFDRTSASIGEMLREDGSREGGRGLMLMRALVDEVDISPGPETGTVVTLTKRLDLEKDSLLARLSGTRGPPGPFTGSPPMPLDSSG